MANNSSGMACGTVANTYRTLESLSAGAAQRARSSTPGAADADERLRALEPELYEGLARLRDRVRNNPTSVRPDRAAVLDEEHHGLRAELVARLTPGRSTSWPIWWSAARARWRSSPRSVFRTVPRAPARDDRPAGVRRPVRRPTRSLPALVDTGPATIELLDATSLRVGQADPQADAGLRADRRSGRTPRCWWSTRPTPPRQLAELSGRGAPVLRSLPAGRAGRAHRATPGRGPGCGTLRKGLYAAGRRGPAVRAPPRCWRTSSSRCRLLDRPARELTELFDQHGYSDSVIFGHAKDGNIHFMLTERLGSAALRPLRRVHRGHGRPRARPGRLAQGRARHRPDDGAVRAPAVRRRALRGDARDQAAVRPAGDAQPGRADQTTTRRRTCATSRSPRPSRRRSTGAWSAATASRSARAGT